MLFGSCDCPDQLSIPDYSVELSRENYFVMRQGIFKQTVTLRIILPLPPMKIFSLCMSIYLMALCCLPCGDSEECEEKAEHQIASKIEHEDHEHPLEACTPFCYCACCSVSVINQPIYRISIIGQSVQQLPIISIVRFYSGDFRSFWQPPKLG